MEPWEAEMQLQWQWERRRQRLHRCQCCGEPITTERYLNLEPYGLCARSCENCVRDNLCENLFEEGV